MTRTPSMSAFLLRLLALPTALGLTLALGSSAIANPANRSATLAKPAVSPTSSLSLSCDDSASPTSSLTKSGTAGVGEGWMDFTAAESDGAVLLFGCDCSSCINALQQLRQNTLLEAMGGHCAANFSRNSSAEQVDDVLEAIAIAESQGPDTPLLNGEPEALRSLKSDEPSF